MIFDTWGGILCPESYERFSLEPMDNVIGMLDKTRGDQVIPNILFTKNGGQWLEKMAQTGCNALGIDWTTNIGEARRRVGHQVALQGNLDPCVLHSSPEVIRQAVHQVLADFGPHPGHVFNLGHGIHPEINPDHVKAMVDAVHDYKPSAVAHQKAVS
jgi:uroporphyrinogen decarboxylase